MSPYEQRKPHRATSRQISRWLPNTWSEIATNEDAKALLINCLGADGDGPNIFLTGPSRCGKTGLITLYLASLACTQRENSPDPCGRCANCVGEVRRQSNNYNLFSAINNSRFDIFKLDCTRPFSEELWPQLKNVGNDEYVRNVVFLDEFHRLANHGQDEKLLLLLEMTGVQFLASSTQPGKLETSVLKRFVHKSVNIATQNEMKTFFKQRCENWMLEVDQADEDEIALLVAGRSMGNCGDVVRFLSEVALRPDRRIDRRLVERFSWSNYAA